MFIEETKKKCRIGEGCLQAVVAHAGYFMKKTNLEDDYGTDYELRELQQIHGKIRDINAIIKIQLKSTTDWTIEDNEIVYDLDVDAYNNIVAHNKDGTTKLILVLMCLETRNDWCRMDNTSIKFQNSLFWYHTDAQEYPGVNRSKRIRIPVNQVFDTDAINNFYHEYLNLSD